MKHYEPVQLRWQRRYAGRRWILGVPVQPEPIGSMVDDLIAFDIAKARLGHAIRSEILWPLNRLLRRVLP